MKTRQRLSLLTVAAMIGVAGCSEGAESPDSTAGQKVAATTSCAGKGELTMWERSGGNKAGRVYDLTVNARDLAGNGVTGTARCTVPHDKGKK